MTRTIDDLLKHLDGRLEEDAYISNVSEALFDLTFEDFFKGYSGCEDPIGVLHRIVFGRRRGEPEEEFFEKEFAGGSVSRQDLKKMKFGNAILHGEDRGVIRDNVPEVFINLMFYPLTEEKNM